MASNADSKDKNTVGLRGRSPRPGSGCYTCRTRKVKCRRTQPLASPLTQSEASEDIPPRCANCERLGLECRWTTPEPGEKYTPPPKRRRTIGHRRARQPSQATVRHQPSPPQETSDQPGESRRHAPNDAEQRSPCSDGVLAPNALDLFPGFSFDLDPAAAFGEVDFDFLADGIDFIPLPAINQTMPLPGSDTGDRLNGDFQEPADHGKSSRETESTRPKRTDAEECEAPQPSINNSNRQLIQHYLEVMKGYAKVDDRARDPNNLFIAAFSKSLLFPPLFYAILSFSAAHLAMEDVSYADDAENYNRMAHESFMSHRRDASAPVEGLLSSLFVRVKTVHVTGGSVAAFLQLISAATEIMSEEPTQAAMEDSESLTRRIVIRLALLDARACQYGLGGGALLEQLRSIPSLSPVFDSPSSVQSPPVVDVTSLLRADVYRMRVGKLDLRLREQAAGCFVTQEPIRTEEIIRLYEDIQGEIGRWEKNTDVSRYVCDDDVVLGDSVLDSTSYGCLAVLSALHSALLYLFSIYPMPFVDSEASVLKILQCQLCIRRDPSRALSPSSVLPSSLIFAGICTRDPIRRDWILERFKEGEKWGLYIRKSRELLQALITTRRHGAALDVCETMDRVTGRFII